MKRSGKKRSGKKRVPKQNRSVNNESLQNSQDGQEEQRPTAVPPKPSDEDVSESRETVTNCDDSPPDPFDLDQLRLSQDFLATGAVKPILTSVPVRDPHRHEFIRVRPGEKWRISAMLLGDKANRNETYLVPGFIQAHLFGSELLNEMKSGIVFLVMSRLSPIPFLWPQPATDNKWHESALECAAQAEKQWVRIASDMHAGMYVPYPAKVELSEPEWPPKVTFQDFIRLGFKDRVIDSLDHPILKRLWGEE